MNKYYLLILLLALNSCRNNPVTSNNSTTNSLTSIRGTITDKYDYPIRPIANAQVFLSTGSTVDTTFSDSSGNYLFLKVPAGANTLVVSAATYNLLVITLEGQNEDTVIFNIELTSSYRYVLGEVDVGFADSTTVEKAFTFISGLGLTIEQLNGFNCQSNLPTDSLSSVQQILGSKSYLDQNSKSIFVSNGAITILETFINLDSGKIADWVATEAQLKITSIPTPYRDGYIQTQKGQEVVWVIKLKNYPIVKWLELDYYIPMFAKTK